MLSVTRDDVSVAGILQGISEDDVWLCYNQGFEGLKSFKAFAVLANFVLPLLDAFLGFSLEKC